MGTTKRANQGKHREDAIHRELARLPWNGYELKVMKGARKGIRMREYVVRPARTLINVTLKSLFEIGSESQ